MSKVINELDKDYYEDEVIVLDDSSMKKQYVELAKKNGIKLSKEETEGFVKVKKDAKD